MSRSQHQTILREVKQQLRDCDGESMLKVHGYTLNDIKVVLDSKGALLKVDWPGVVVSYMDDFKARRLGALQGEVLLSWIGSLARFIDLSDASLNRQAFRIVSIDLERDRVVVDATPEGSPPSAVRYVSLPREKMGAVHTQGSGHDVIPCLTAIAATNSEAAFDAAGLDRGQVRCLAVRADPRVRMCMAFSDVPALCKTLNTERAPGSPFDVVFGYQIFGEPDSSWRPGSPLLCEATLSCEPYVVLRDVRGCLIDVAPDIGADMAGCQHKPMHFKLFVTDETLTCTRWGVGGGVAEQVTTSDWWPQLPFRDDLNRVMHDRFSIMISPFADSALTLSKPGSAELHAFQIQQRRHHVVNARAVLLSPQLLCDLAAMCSPGNAMYIHRSSLGTICFACYTRIRECDAKICAGCGLAHYCSIGCQKWHAAEHKPCCVPSDVSKQRSADEAERRRRHDAHEERVRAEARAIELERAALAARTRADRVVKQVAIVAERKRRAAPGPSHRARSGGGKASRKRTTGNQLVHEAWDSQQERAARTASFVANQDATKAEAEARKARAHADALRLSTQEIPKARRPTPLNLGAFVAPKPAAPLATLADWSPPKPGERAAADDDGRSVASVATTNIPLPTPTAHAAKRAADRHLDQRELQ